MSRLPQIGGDKGSWGQILNDFLLQAHANDGSLLAQSDIDDAKTKADTAIQNVNGQTGTSITLTPNTLGAMAADASNATTGALTQLGGGLTHGVDSPTNPATGLLYVQTSNDSTTLYANVEGQWWQIGGGRVGASLVAAYSFDEGTGALAADSSGGGNDLTISGATPWTTGHTGDGLNGVGGGTGTATFALGGSGSWTIMAWLYLASVPVGQKAGVLYSSVQDYDLLWVDTSGYVGSDAHGGYEFSYQLPVATWTHIAVVNTGNTVSLYVNGESYSTDNSSYWNVTSTSTYVVSGSSVVSQGSGSGSTQPFTGVIDDLRMYNVASSSDDIVTAINTPVS